MLKTTVTRQGEFTPIPPAAYRAASRKRCRVCGVRYGKMVFDKGRFEVWTAAQHIHHLIPRRFLEEHGINPHKVEGLFSVCQQCHGKAKAPEDRLFQGDVLGFLQGMKRANFPVEKIVTFAVRMGFLEFRRVFP